MGRDREKNREWRRKYREEHKIEIIEYRRKYNADPSHKSRHNEKQKEWAKNNPEKVKEINRVKRSNSEFLERDRIRDLKRRYGISIDDYNLMFDTQNGCCAICKKHQSELKKSLFVDHDHNTEKIRGLICFRCNAALGLFNDDINNLLNAIKHLQGGK
jgi:hypothetical protein